MSLNASICLCVSVHVCVRVGEFVCRRTTGFRGSACVFVCVCVCMRVHERILRWVCVCGSGRSVLCMYRNWLALVAGPGPGALSVLVVLCAPACGLFRAYTPSVRPSTRFADVVLERRVAVVLLCVFFCVRINVCAFCSYA